MNKKNFLLFLIFLFFSFFLNANTFEKKNSIYLIRHALAPGNGDPDNFDLSDCSTQRNLNATGILQSFKIAQFFIDNEIVIDNVYSSQWCRCKDTAKYAFKDYKEFPALNSTFQPPHDKNAKNQIKELRDYIQKWNGNGGNLVLVTHYVIITAITDVVPRSGEIVIIDKNFNTLSSNFSLLKLIGAS